MKNIDHDHLEDLLRRASPRPVPSPEDEAAVRALVQSEWLAVAGSRRRRRRVMQLALAASVVLAVFAAFNAFRIQPVAPIEVGTIAKSFGPVYVLGESSELRETKELANIVVGQTIVTGSDAGLAIAWANGGSLRVDENTRLAFLDDASVRLEAGRVYYDSVLPPYQSNSAADTSEALVLETQHGEIRHVGTQYMVYVDQQDLIVSVREGRVDIDGRYHSQTARSGQRVTLSGPVLPTVLSIGRNGGDWAWIDRTTPATDVEGKSLHEYLIWACREMGLELIYEGGAEARAQDAGLRGIIDIRPSEALPLRLASVDLRWRIEKGVIYISDQSR